MGAGIILGELIDHFYEYPNIELKDSKGKLLFKGNAYEMPLEFDKCEVMELRQGDIIGVTVWR